MIDFERAHCLVETLLERAPDAHRFAHRAHLHPEGVVGPGEFLEREARDLRHDVVDGGLEARRGLAGDVVADLVERVADGELRGDLGDREAGGLGGQRGRAGHARVHLDHDQLAGPRVHGELDVRPPGVDADLADDGERRGPHLLVLAVGQGLGGRHGDGVAGVHPHRVEVLDRADDDDVVGAVAHHLEFVFLPAENALLEEHFAPRRLRDAPGDDLVELGLFVCHTRPGAPERERGPHDRGEAHVGQECAGFFDAAHIAGAGHPKTDAFDRLAEALAIFGFENGF